MSSCRKAHNRYTIYLDEQKELARKEMEANKLEAAAAVALEAKKDAEKRKDEKLTEINRKINSLESGITVAEESISEANQELSNMLTKSGKVSKSKLLEEVTKAQSKVEMGLQRKQELTEELQNVVAKKKKIEEK